MHFARVVQRFIVMMNASGPWGVPGYRSDAVGNRILESRDSGGTITEQVTGNEAGHGPDTRYGTVFTPISPHARALEGAAVRAQAILAAASECHVNCG